ncbi:MULTISPECIES: hypothetical protein [unclassified Campylobacter]|uniref:hypothetical protein n=1 Tax=unclassified Campylobacter TaxID=2593542 RepID=UPI001BDA8385|nr:MULTISPECIES: hypothetical protein [unclassified Campylobacter]MBZ7983655.1 hypothetical protein [Campylobacter sp. RM12647]MBT0878293.1 hypothetical protein [Campylobacter sp. 2018MI01]MBT0879806.1 hypothetical protein [Campylobacter sp. 2018MI27]MBT0885172.1 hypothetical protein [Campylobacter sp. 2018MI10]ULO03478.1 hypothetical protein AVBRAN_1019 [Campylobacter sp. RM12651]
MKKLLLILISTYLFADSKIDFSDKDTILLFVVLGGLIVLLLAYIYKLKMKLKTKKVKMFSVSDEAEFESESFEKSSLYFDLQEVFLYFFKTLNYEASVKNNIFLVRQDMLYLNDNNEKCMPNRYFYGDYTNIINAIWAAADLINQNVENETIFIDIGIMNNMQNRTLLCVDIGVCGVVDDKKTELFKSFTNPKKLSISEQLHKFSGYMKKIDGSSYAFKDTNERINHAICLSIPILINDKENNLPDVTPKDRLSVLIVHNNIDISKTITANLESYEINCIQNQSSNGLLEKIEDGVNCAYRAVLLDANLINTFNEYDLNRLVKAQDEYCFKLILILNNHKITPNIEKIIQEVDFLPLPYTIDNIRSIVNIIKTQQEKLLS